MKFAVKSDKGLVRNINEDSYNIIAGHTGIPAAFIIADGMGGHNSGEIASRMAVDLVSNHIMQFPEKISSEENISEAIEDMVQKANVSIHEMSREQGANFGMGTTFIVAVICGKKLFIGHVGDSRVYLARNGGIARITTDHSFIEELIKNGSLKREEAGNHPRKNMLTRALGCFEEILIDTYSCDVLENDTFILCTDGLTNMLGENEINDIVQKAGEPDDICNKLVSRANEYGGEDNITVIALKND